MIKRLFVVTLLLGATSLLTETFAQKKYIAVVHTNTGKRYNGIISEATAKDFTLRMHGGGLHIFAADTVEKIKVRSKNALNKNLLLGVMTGLGTGALVYNNQFNKGNVNTTVLPTLVVASIVSGAGVGGLFNSFFSKEKFENVSANYSQMHQKLAAYAVPATNK